MNTRIFRVFFFTVVGFLSLQAQNTWRVDSLLNILEKYGQDTNRVNTLIALMDQYGNDFEKGSPYINQAFELAQKLNFKRGIYRARKKRALLFFRHDMYEKALEAFLDNMRWFEKEGMEDEVIYSNNNLGLIYQRQKKEDLAFEHFRIAMNHGLIKHDTAAIVSGLTNIGITHLSLLHNDSALLYFQQAYVIFENKKDLSNMANISNGLGAIELELGKTDEAEKTFQNSLAIYRKLNDDHGIANSLIALGTVFRKKKSYEEAVNYFLEGVKQGKKVTSPDILRDAFTYLRDTYAEKGDYKNAYEYSALFSKTSDSLLNVENSKQMEEMKTKYETEKKDKALLKKDAELIKEHAGSERKSLQRNFFIVGFGLMIVLAFFILRVYRQKQKINKKISHQKAIIEEKQKEIIDSIKYAQRIQKALITSEKYIERVLNKLN